MKKFLRRLNDLPIFDPGRWPRRELVARLMGCLAVSAVLLWRILQLRSFPGVIGDVAWIEAWFGKLTFLPPRWLGETFPMEPYYRAFGYSPSEIRFLWTERLLVWIVETGILAGYIVAFLTRDRAQSVAKGFMQVVFPLLMAGLPFLIVRTDYTFHQWMPASSRAHLGALGAIFIVLILGGTLNLVGLYTLRRAFTIMTEARAVIRTGVYRFIRHPLYAGHFVVYLGYTLLHFHLSTVLLYLAFVAGQTLRARIEERKLVATFPEYEEYRRTTGMFFPRLG